MMAPIVIAYFTSALIKYLIKPSKKKNTTFVNDLSPIYNDDHDFECQMKMLTITNVTCGVVFLSVLVQNKHWYHYLDQWLILIDTILKAMKVRLIIDHYSKPGKLRFHSRKSVWLVTKNCRFKPGNGRLMWSYFYIFCSSCCPCHLKETLNWGLSQLWNGAGSLTAASKPMWPTCTQDSLWPKFMAMKVNNLFLSQGQSQWRTSQRKTLTKLNSFFSPYCDSS